MNLQTCHVLFLWSPEEKLKTKLQITLTLLSNVQLWFPPESKDKKEIAQFCETHAPKAHIMVGWRPKKEWFSTAQNLQLYINPGTGIRHLLEMMREVNQKRPLTLINGHGHAHLVAQHTLALLLTLLNQVIPHHQWLKNGNWRTGDAYSASIPLYQRKIGLLGYGAINQKLHQLIAPFGVDVSILKREWAKKRAFLSEELLEKAQKFSSNELHPFLQSVDTLIIAVPSTPKTDGMIGGEELMLLGKKGFLVNVARGNIVEEKALYEALKNEVIGGAAIDVWYNYRPKADENGKRYPYEFPFHELKNVVLSPHRAGSPFSELARWDEIIDNILQFATGNNEFKNVVSLEHGY